MCLARLDKFPNDGIIGLPWTAVWSTGKLVEAPVTILLEAFDPLIGCLLLEMQKRSASSVME